MYLTYINFILSFFFLGVCTDDYNLIGDTPTYMDSDDTVVKKLEAHWTENIKLYITMYYALQY